eukprot:CAMPEP_0182886296 /NCGR_PEP_ID=MMETSP0034_2-20130328/20129_1 /TAXON_ID=156128 /ORGANISM="Nephroselmis pyriformis, Strain CCMP717" /LENGTH=70 /DNA_ID=CAMNT_0025019611 /DNA_START=147 /DNA_END=356 /DNA_ORIENTATION=+
MAASNSAEKARRETRLSTAKCTSYAKLAQEAARVFHNSRHARHEWGGSALKQARERLISQQGLRGKRNKR